MSITMAISQNYRHVTESPKTYAELTIREAKKLHRLVSLSANLSGQGKTSNWLEFTSSEELERLRLRRNLYLQSLLKAIEANPHECSKDFLIATLGKRVLECTKDFLNTTLNKDPKSVIQLYRDLKTIQTHPPMQKTLAGRNGPTFIVSYPIWELDSSMQKIDKGISCILKWTDDAEITGHRFFEAFATGFHFKRNCYEREFFYIPKLTCFDLDRGKIFEKGHTFLLSSEEKDSLLKELLGSVTDYQLPKPQFSPTSKIVARIEKVSGKNFPQFIQADFPGLSEEIKKSLFRRIGKIAFLDFVLGNTDRLFSLDNDTVTLSDYESNLDNLMLQSLDEGIAIFLIDNAIDKLYLQEGFKEKYLDLLKDTFSSHDSSKKLTQSIVEGISQRMKEVRFSRSFQEDLTCFGQENIQLGIEEMERSFSSLAVDFKEKSKSFENSFDGLNKEISEALSERIANVGNILQRRQASTLALDPKSVTPQFSGSFSMSDNSPSKWLLSPQASLRNFLWEISNHCKGTKEDELFFQTTLAPEIPFEYLSESITNILLIIHEVKEAELPKHRFEKMRTLNILVNHALDLELNASRAHSSPLEGIAPSPLITPTHPISEEKKKNLSPIQLPEFLPPLPMKQLDESHLLRR